VADATAAPGSSGVRTALVDATTQLLVTGEAVAPSDWDRPGTDRWTVRELFAHLVRSVTVIGEYLDADLPRHGPGLGDAAGYYRVALDTPGVHDGIARRASDGAVAAGADPVPRARAVVAATLDRVAVTPDDRVIVHSAGWLPFDQYLVTRVVEVVLHTWDVQLACGQPLAAPVSALDVVVPLLLRLTDRVDPRALALALTGRSSTLTCDVLG
jgi:uncharacterized protein (TIGR03083 family)